MHYQSNFNKVDLFYYVLHTIKGIQKQQESARSDAAWGETVENAKEFAVGIGTELDFRTAELSKVPQKNSKFPSFLLIICQPVLLGKVILMRQVSDTFQKTYCVVFDYLISYISDML